MSESAAVRTPTAPPVRVAGAGAAEAPVRAAAKLTRDEPDVESNRGPELPKDIPMLLAALPRTEPPAPGGPIDAGLCDAGDVKAFLAELSGTVCGGEAEWPGELDPLARGLADVVDDAFSGTRANFDFDIDLPGWGLLQGRVALAHGQADVELRACRPSSAHALRGRQSELQRLVDRESGGAVNLFIV